MLDNILKKIKEDYFISYIYLYIFLMPWNFINDQMGILSIILVIWWLIIGKRKEYFSKMKTIFEFKPLLLIILFFTFSYLSLLWTDNYEAAITGLKYYKYYWIMIPVLFTTLTKEQAKNGLYILIFSVGCYALFSILIYLNIVHIIDHTSDPTGISNPRGILAYAIITPYMAIGFLSSLIIAYYNNSKIIKVVFIAIAFLCLFGLLINNGRAGQLAFFSTFGVLLIIYRKYLINPKILLSIIFILSTSIYLLNNLNKLDRFETGIKSLKNLEKTNFSGSWGARAYMWYAAADILKKDPILGVGTGDNIDRFIEYTKTNPSNSTWMRSFHNQHLDTLTKYGIVGYLLLWGSIVWLLYSLKNNKFYFSLGIIFFSITFFDGFGDIILLMKPYNNIFMLVFLLLSITIYKQKYSIEDKSF